VGRIILKWCLKKIISFVKFGHSFSFVMKYLGNKFGRKRFSTTPKEQGQAKHEVTQKNSLLKIVRKYRREKNFATKEANNLDSNTF